MASKNVKSASGRGAVRKSVTRNVDVPLTISDKCRRLRKIPWPSTGMHSQPSTSKGVCGKFRVPELNTALDIVKEMEQLSLEKPVKISSVKDLTPRSKAIVAQEVTKKLNFPPEKQVYKGLIPINVNDSILIPEKRRPIRKEYIGRSSRDPVPELSDFLTPIEPMEHKWPLYDRPDVFRKPNNDNFEKIQELYMKYHPDF